VAPALTHWRSFLQTCVTNLVSVLPATPHCKPNHPVHPHSKPKSGLGRGYISSDATRETTWCRSAKLLVERRTPGLEESSSSFILQRRVPPSSIEASASFIILSILSIYLLHLLRRVPPSSTEVSSSFIQPPLPNEVPPVREVTERRSPSPIPLLPAASSNSHPVNLCSTSPAIHHGECIRSRAK